MKKVNLVVKVGTFEFEESKCLRRLDSLERAEEEDEEEEDAIYIYIYLLGQV